MSGSRDGSNASSCCFTATPGNAPDAPFDRPARGRQQITAKIFLFWDRLFATYTNAVAGGKPHRIRGRGIHASRRINICPLMLLTPSPDRETHQTYKG